MPSGSWSEFQARPILSANINLFMSMWHGSLLVLVLELLLLPTPCWIPSCRQWEMESQLPSSSRSYFRRRWRRLQIAWGRILIILHCFDSNACCSLAGWVGFGAGRGAWMQLQLDNDHYRSVMPLANASQAFHPFGFGFWPGREG